MLKHIIILILLSLLIVLFMPYAQDGLQAIITAHDWISDMLLQVFSGGQAGNITRQLIALLAIPIIAGLIPVIIFWMVKRRWLPCFMTIVWVMWLLQTSALVILYKAAEITAS